MAKKTTNDDKATKGGGQDAGGSDREQRLELRRHGTERVFAQIVDIDDPNMIGAFIPCLALDKSASGIRARSTERVPVGTLLDLWVDDVSRPGSFFFLTSEVRWLSEDDEGCQFGLHLHETVATDINNWRSVGASA